MQSIQCQAEIESRYAALLQESREAKQFKAEIVQYSRRLEKEAKEHEAEKKGFKEVLDRLEKEKTIREAELGKARREYEEVVHACENQVIAKDAHIIRLEKDLKAAYAEVAVQKVRDDGEIAAAT